MAHYAFLNSENIVVEVITGVDESDDNIDWEKHYGNFRGLECRRTSYNTIGGIHISGGKPFRKNYAGIGYTYDHVRDAFIPPKPYPSWLLNEDSCLWEPPIERPEGNVDWDEQSQSWVISD